MRVTHIINTLSNMGGAERLVLDLCRLMPDTAHTVIVIRGEGVFFDEKEAAPPVKVVPLLPFRIGSLRTATNVLRTTDVLHVHLFPALALGALIPKPKIFTEHNTWNRRRDLKIWSPFEHMVYRRYDRIAAISEAVRDALQDWLKSGKPEIDVVPNGIVIERFSGAKNKLKSSKITLGMAGRLVPQKDFETLIHSMSYLPSNYELYIAGDGPLRADLEKIVEDKGLTGQVKFCGTLKDMRSFYSELDLYVHSSKVDGFSLVTVEAMAAGLPVLVSDIPGLRATVGSAEALFPAGDAATLAEKVRNTCENRDLYDIEGSRSLERARVFDARTMADRYKEMYEAVMKKRSASALDNE